MLYRNVAAPSTALALLLCFLLLLARAPAQARQPGDGLKLAYASYPELAAAVRQRMDGKAAPAPALGALARELTAGRPDPRMRALALADWVRTHIRHADARLRFDGAAPRPAAAVLAQRSGNCEEIAVLLRALLAENGIASTAALVRDGDDYTLPDVAMPAAFDHMLVYLPGLDLCSLLTLCWPLHYGHATRRNHQRGRCRAGAGHGRRPEHGPAAGSLDPDRAAGRAPGGRKRRCRGCLHQHPPGGAAALVGQHGDGGGFATCWATTSSAATRWSRAPCPAIPT
jgi:hypothetical protein